MPRLLWIGNFFHQNMAALGWNVIHHLPAEGETLAWQDCLRLADGAPDALVIGDMSLPPFVLGVEAFPCPTVFYAVDTHIHSWMPRYAQAFDACLVSLKDHLPRFLGQRLTPEQLFWSPPYAPDLNSALSDPAPERPRDVDCLFVGTVHPETTPLRVLFFEELSTLIPGLRMERGNFQLLYPNAKTVINFCEYGDLNFRVFEAMGCGAALVTPALGHGQTELFEPGRHLQTYAIPSGPDARRNAREAAASAAAQIRALLERPEERLRMARAGFDEINARHRASHRAQNLHEKLTALPPERIAQRRAEAGAIRERWLKLVYLLWADSLPDSPLQARYLRAARGEL